MSSKTFRWQEWQKEFVLNNIGKLQPAEISKKIGRSEIAIQLFLHRKRNHPKTVIKDNTLLKILSEKFIHPEYFYPNRDFFEAVKIGQKRFWRIYKGIIPITDEECKRIADHLEIPFEDIFKARQLDLFGDK